MPIIEPRTDVDYKLTIVPPDPNVDFKMLVRPVDGAEPAEKQAKVELQR